MNLPIVAIKTPIFQSTELLEDLSAFSGAKILGDQYSEFSKISDADPAHILGKLSSAKIDKNESIFKAFDQNNTEI